jgi:glutamate synthase (NADPH) large chain
MNPQEQFVNGLYRPEFEHDACGVGFVVSVKGVKSHSIVAQALQVLHNLDHRGATGAEKNTGDGAGILVQIPHKLFLKKTKELGFALPAAGEYGVGMWYLPPSAKGAEAAKALIAGIVTEEGLSVLGWRAVPVSNATLGKGARDAEPSNWQCFVGKPAGLDADAFERKLYMVRKRSENAAMASDLAEKSFIYSPSMSSRTLVYKGMLTVEQVSAYFADLSDADMESAIALVHSRFSTNTFPSWNRAQPKRFIIHNGEINTVRGNVNWMRARQSTLHSQLFGTDLKKTYPIIDETGSDSSMFDNALEFLCLNGWSLPHAMLMMIPEAWQNHETMDPKRKAFYEYHASMMEPWDGPAAMAATDGSVVSAVLDRNGLRPSRYYVTKDDMVVFASEVGVLDIAEENIVKKGRLEPGRIFLIDTAKGRIIDDEELKADLANAQPYADWVKGNQVAFESLPTGEAVEKDDAVHLRQRLQAFGYTTDELRKIVAPMVTTQQEAIGSMGDDTPLAVLSDKSKLLYNYFRQLFAQVTNPPIDAIREKIVTSSRTSLGNMGDILTPGPENAKQIVIENPILSNEEMDRLRNLNHNGFKSVTLPMLFRVADDGKGLEAALESMFEAAAKQIRKGVNIIILSDRGINSQMAPMPSLLAVAGLHHYLVREELRTQASIVVESGDARNTHHFALLLGYGASAINPYLAIDAVKDMIDRKIIEGFDHAKAVKNYLYAAIGGVIKTLSKMGISTVQSYRGAQIFEAVGLKQLVVDKYFTRTASRIEGIGLDVISKEVAIRHERAFDERFLNDTSLTDGGFYQWRKNGEHHLFNPYSIQALQKSTRLGDYGIFKDYAASINDQSKKLATIRGLMQFKKTRPSIPLSEVESVESIVKRFKTGAMSFGSISQEAHETMAIAMNRLGGKSNSGEGGEDASRYVPMANGDSKSSAIKQVASGRFGVTSHYLVNAKEIQIKMAQGAKPGEGGQLPGSKVYPWVARVRGTTPGVQLISPPPHHDIYSIEDLAQLIFDLKNSNDQARISVKLVSEVGVGTVAAGVAKGHADVVLVSGFDGGTGASPQSSIKHAGLPWELGLAETHQTLVLNNLRSRIVVETDGQLKTGRDVAVAALLGAEEFGFATAPLVVMGCIMMRVCHLNTCPVGVATQDPELRAKFCGSVDALVNFFRFVAEEMREIMAELGFKTVQEMVGHSECLETRDVQSHWKAKGLDLSSILAQPVAAPEVGRFCTIAQEHGLEKTLDRRTLLSLCAPAIERGEHVEATLEICNRDRTVGTMTGSYISRRHGAEGLPTDTIKLHFKGHAGQSFGAFCPKGMTMHLEGDANDYVGKGLSGAHLAVFPAANVGFKPEENIVIGNVALFGATGGKLFARGLAGERFAVRNSGAETVVEGVGDHACEYMTGGRVTVLGKTGRNFAAGMSGGIAYVYDVDGQFDKRCNKGMVGLEALEAADLEYLQSIIAEHQKITGSTVAAAILADWASACKKFIKIMPTEYKKILGCFDKVRAEGKVQGEDAIALAAFELSLK